MYEYYDPPNAPWNQEPNYCKACDGEGKDEFGDTCEVCKGWGYLDEEPYEWDD